MKMHITPDVVVCLEWLGTKFLRSFCSGDSGIVQATTGHILKEKLAGVLVLAIREEPYKICPHPRWVQAET